MGVELLGIEIYDGSFDDAVESALALVNREQVSQIVTINPEMFSEAECNSAFKQVLDAADLIVPDGVGVKIALGLKGKKVTRIPGIDLSRKILEKCADKDIPVALIGSKDEVVLNAVKNLKKDISNLNIVYFRNGYFTENNEIYENIKKSGAKLVLIALGSPKQEFFIYNAKKVLSSVLMIGVGGSFDVWSGNIKRAPKIYQMFGLEWLYRTVMQPERFKRIFPALPLFLLKVLFYRGDK